MKPPDEEAIAEAEVYGQQLAELVLETNVSFDSAPTLFANYSSDHALLLDGFCSTSDLVNRWTTRLRQECPDLQLPTNAFSYLHPGWPYSGHNTGQVLETYSKVVRAHLPATRCNVIPIGFSLGGILTLRFVATRRARRAPGIPAVILIAPFHNPDAAAMASAFQAALPRQHSWFPALVPQLGQTRVHKRILSYYAMLTTRQIHVYLIYSKYDDFASVHSVIAPLSASLSSSYWHPLEATPTTGFLSRRPTAQQSFRYHRLYKSSKEVLQRVCSILADASNFL